MSTSSQSSAGASPRYWFLGRRRSFFLPGPYQARTVLKVGGLALALLVVADVVLYLLVRVQADRVVEMAPALEPAFRSQDRLILAHIFLGSLVALLGILAVAVLETHKTAGPLYNLVRTMERLAEQGPPMRVQFRKDDHFKELETAFNRMAESLAERANGRAEKVQRIAAEVRAAVDALESRAGEPGERLRTCAAELDRMAEHQRC